MALKFSSLFWLAAPKRSTKVAPEQAYQCCQSRGLCSLYGSKSCNFQESGHTMVGLACVYRLVYLAVPISKLTLCVLFCLVHPRLSLMLRFSNSARVGVAFAFTLASTYLNLLSSLITLWGDDDLICLSDTATWRRGGCAGISSEEVTGKANDRKAALERWL